MKTLFISSLCPHCPPAVEYAKKLNEEVRIVDITSSIKNLKEFLKYRDSDPYFDEIKKNNKIGIPTFMDGDGEHFYSISEY